MHFFKKALLSALLIIAIAVPAFATVNVTWEWILDDPEVQYFRYQLGGEAADGWTVVPSDVTTFELLDVDGSVSYTLYLQQSYDGENWSASAYAVSTPFIPEVPADPVATVVPVEAPVEEVVAPVEPAEAPVVVEPVETVEVVEEAQAEVVEAPVEEKAVVEEAPVVEEPVVIEEPVEVVEMAVVEDIATPIEEVAAPVVETVALPTPVSVADVKAKTNNYAMTLDFSFGALYRITNPVTANLSNMAIKANLGLGLENVIRIGDNHGIGFWFDTFALFDDVKKLPSALDYFKISNYGKELGFDALLTYNYNKEHFKLIVGAGADFRLSPTYASGAFSVFKRTIPWSYNIVGQVQARWQINDLFSLGLLGNYAYNIKNNIHEVGGTLSMGFSF